MENKYYVLYSIEALILFDFFLFSTYYLSLFAPMVCILYPISFGVLILSEEESKSYCLCINPKVCILYLTFIWKVNFILVIILDFWTSFIIYRPLGRNVHYAIYPHHFISFSPKEAEA